MNLQEYKESKKVKWDAFDKGVEKGFDAAMGLQLPVKYTRWRASIFKRFTDSKRQPDRWKEIEKTFDKLGKTYSEENLFQYWLDNIFKIE